MRSAAPDRTPKGKQTILPIQGQSRAAVETLLSALDAAGFHVLPQVNFDNLTQLIQSSAPPDLVLLDASNYPATAAAIQGNLQTDLRWCLVPTVVLNCRSEGRLPPHIAKPPVAPEIAFPGIPLPEELFGSILEVVAGRTPACRLRRLERQRVQSRIALQTELGQIDQTMAGLTRAVRDASERLDRSEHRMQALRRARGRLVDASIPMMDQIQDWIVRQASTRDSYREQIRAFEVERRQLLLRRHQASRARQTEIEELDRQVYVLSELIRFSRSMEKNGEIWNRSAGDLNAAGRYAPGRQEREEGGLPHVEETPETSGQTGDTSGSEC